jgi:hypothetical protein
MRISDHDSVGAKSAEEFVALTQALCDDGSRSGWLKGTASHPGAGAGDMAPIGIFELPTAIAMTIAAR